MFGGITASDFSTFYVFKLVIITVSFFLLVLLPLSDGCSEGGDIG